MIYAITILAAVIIVTGGAVAVAWRLDSQHTAEPGSLPDEDGWTADLHGGTRLARRMSAELRSKGLMLPSRASAATRKLAVALDKSRPGHGLTAAVRARISSPSRTPGQPARQAGRHRATPAPAATPAAREVAHTAAPEPPAQMPEAQEDPATIYDHPGTLYPDWATGQFAAVVLDGGEA